MLELMEQEKVTLCEVKIDKISRQNTAVLGDGIPTIITEKINVTRSEFWDRVCLLTGERSKRR